MSDLFTIVALEISSGHQAFEPGVGSTILGFIQFIFWLTSHGSDQFTSLMSSSTFIGNISQLAMVHLHEPLHS